MSTTTAASSSPTRTITVLYFAAASTATGLTTEQVPLPSTPPPPAENDGNDDSASFPLTALADVLAARHPGTDLRQVLEQSQWAVSEEMVDDPARVVLRGGEEVAVICPVSGG
ncbi:hypothetical protein BV20DRAFT_947474 [Pilatotrama ljubarskyi]|nr:hypothetical protein BV20DRAFT_947474 [Pilatotrama ljubarskyi]